MKKTLCVISVLLCFGLPLAMADSIEFALAPNHAYQQTTNNPCVIGNSSCNQPAGFGYFEADGHPFGTTYDLFSPVYVVGGAVGATNVIPASFTVGIDDNYANDFESLVFFKVWTSTTEPVGFPGEGGTSAPFAGFVLDSANSWVLGPEFINVDNGNGYADAILTGFNLTPGTYVFFEASVSNDSDGFEQFYLIPATNPPSQIPEPSTVVLIGFGLVALAGFARRRK